MNDRRIAAEKALREAERDWQQRVQSEQDRRKLVVDSLSLDIVGLKEQVRTAGTRLGCIG